ncbi:hypothetical protein CVV65_06255 [Kyrpidia spormannii]|uniref:Purine catabolism PurC-like domain-containing protein n=1 Tax=Kyrpidia spormannii TaxID=2055160 RepID=A0A2K8N719_9BACL|nr:hypothetical protein CVV65_06255 [Kyrpidia spormannii]
MNVRDLLAIPILADAKVVAGASGLARNVQSVNMMDAPDIIDFLKPNELLVTTGYGLKDHPGALVDLVRQMAQKGCAGLGIKIRRFLPETPPEMVRAADEWALPIDGVDGYGSQYRGLRNGGQPAWTRDECVAGSGHRRRGECDLDPCDVGEQRGWGQIRDSVSGVGESVVWSSSGTDPGVDPGICGDFLVCRTVLGGQ